MRIDACPSGCYVVTIYLLYFSQWLVEARAGRPALGRLRRSASAGATRRMSPARMGRRDARDSTRL